MTDFGKAIAEAYAVEGAAIDLGRGVHDGKLAPDAVVQVPLRMMNRHGLIAGATGTGKTITLQTLAEQLSAAGVSVFAADVKGDVSGVAAAGASRAARRRSGCRSSGSPSSRRASPSSTCRWAGSAPAFPCGRRCPTSARSCSPRSSRRTRPRSRASSSSSTTRTRRACAARPLGPAGAAHLPRVGRGQDRARGIGGTRVVDRRRAAPRARGPRDRRRQRVLRRAPVRHRRPDAHRAGRARHDLGASSCRPSRTSRSSSRPPSCGCSRSCSSSCRRPATWTSRSWSSSSTRRTCCSTARPRRSSTPSTQTVRLIRSKGVGVFFVTQVPDDVPSEVLGQLGNRVQHALRAFTPDDAKALKAAASTYPEVGFLRRRGAAHVDGDRRGGGDDPVGRRRADARRAHAPARAGVADRAGGRRGGSGEGVAAVRQVRHPRGGRERAREAGRRGSTPRRSPPGRRYGARRREPRRRASKAPGTSERGSRSWATSWARARARRSSARSRAACSGC